MQILSTCLCLKSRMSKASRLGLSFTCYRCYAVCAYWFLQRQVHIAYKEQYNTNPKEDIAMTAHNEKEPVHSTEAIREAASLMIGGLQRTQSDDLTTYVLRENHDEHLYISPDLSKFLCAILSPIEEGGEVIFAPNTKLFGLEEAADILAVPVEYLNRLIAEGKFATRTENDLTMVEALSLFAYKRKRDKEFDQGFRELIHLTRDLY